MYKKKSNAHAFKLAPEFKINKLYLNLLNLTGDSAESYQLLGMNPVSRTNPEDV